MKAHELLAKLNELGGKRHRPPDLVENRYVGMSPAAVTKLRAAPSCCALTAPSSRSPSTAKSPTSRTTHAALRQHDLHRLLVVA